MACPPDGATPKQPNIGASGTVNVPSAVSGATSAAVPPRAIDAPLPLQALRQAAHVRRVDHVGGEHGAAPAGVAIGGNPLQDEREHIARRGAIDVEGAGLRVAARGYRRAAGIATGRIHRGRGDGVAVGDV